MRIYRISTLFFHKLIVLNLQPPHCLVVFLSGGASVKRVSFVCILCCLYSIPVVANIASAGYVNAKLDTKVDTSANIQQTMAGDYTVTGTLKVPTQPLLVVQ